MLLNKTIFFSLAVSGVMLVVFALAIDNYPYFMVGALLSLTLGILVSPIIIASNTIIHNVSDNNMMGKIFSSLEIIMHLGFLLFMFISSLLAERYSHLWILVVVGCLVSILGVLGMFIKPIRERIVY